MYYFILVVNGKVDFDKKNRDARRFYRNAKGILIIIDNHNKNNKKYNMCVRRSMVYSYTYIIIHSYYCICSYSDINDRVRRKNIFNFVLL